MRFVWFWGDALALKPNPATATLIGWLGQYGDKLHSPFNSSPVRRTRLR